MVKEKEKEAEMFYKSSDSEEDEEKDKPMEVDGVNENDNKNETNTVFNNESSNSLKDKTNFPDEPRTALQQQCLDQGVIRNLFTQDNVEEPKSVSTSLREENHINIEKKEINIKENDGSPETESMDVDISDGKIDKTITEEKEDDCKRPKSIESSTESSEKISEKAQENSTEEIVLNMPETETDTFEEKRQNKEDNLNKSESNCKNMENNQELKKNSSEHTVLDERVALSSDDENKLTECSNSGLKESDNPVLKLSEDAKEENEILDPKALENDFSLPAELDEPKEPSLKEQVLAQALKFKPKIRDCPGSVIDFSSSKELEEGAMKLKDRFFRHNMARKPRHEEISEVKVLRPEGVGDDIKIIEEVLTFKKDEETKPGLKLKQFKENLRRKILSARNEEWNQKEENEKEEEEEEAKCKDDDFYEGLPDEEEILEDDESAESEPEEDDIPIVESRRRKCEFGDDEAEESECGEDEESDVNCKKRKNEDDEESEESDEEDEESEEDEEEDTVEEITVSILFISDFIL